MNQRRTRIRVRPIIRVFVSSTFSDFKLERNALAQYAWPNLEQRCLEAGFQFQAIDLRWGVPTEAGHHHRTMRICFEELRRSQEVSPEPNFLILLGNRYGWRPLPEEISDSEFNELAKHAEDHAARNILESWYRCDFNSSETVYLLRPRTESPDRNDYTKHENTNGEWNDCPDWVRVQATLWRIVNRAYPAGGLRHRFQSTIPNTDKLPSIVRFQASATEQEIWLGALNAPHAEQHVLAFFREIVNHHRFSPTEVTEFFDLNESRELDDDAQQTQVELKAAIRARLSDAAVRAIPFTRLQRIDDQVLIDAPKRELDKFCNDVETSLWTIIERQIHEYWRPQSSQMVMTSPSTDERTVREFELERQEHLRFAAECGNKEVFVGRQDWLQRILAYLNSDSRFPLVVHGASGCGKTALLARGFQDVPQEAKAIIRFIGVTPRSSDVRSLLTTLCSELRHRHPLSEGIPADIDDLIQEFHAQLHRATRERPIILFLDALDQLSDTDNGRQLHWLAFGTTPIHVKIVLSCPSDRGPDVPAGEPFTVLMRRDLPEDNVLSLNALSVADANQLLTNIWLRLARRQIASEVQLRQIQERLESDPDNDMAPCRQPYYLKLVFEEVRLWRSFDTRTELGANVSEILTQLTKRLRLEHNHGDLLVIRVLGYLAAARRGLRETELLEVLFADREYHDLIEKINEDTRHSLPSTSRRIPIAIWSRLRSDLAPYLTERSAPGGGVLSFFHRHVAEWVQQNLTTDVAPDLHERLAEYFRGLPSFLGSDMHANDSDKANRRRSSNIRKLDELPWQLAHAEQWNQLSTLLSTLDFIEAKCASETLFDLIEDFSYLPDTAHSAVVSNVRTALQLSLSTIAARPALALQSLYNALRWIEPHSPVLDSDLRRASQRLLERSPWLCAEAKPWPEAPKYGNFGIWTSIQSRTSAEQLFAVAAPDGRVEIRDASTGKLRERRQLPYPNIHGIAMQEHGSRLAWVDGAGTVGVDGCHTTLQARSREGNIDFHSQMGVVVVDGDDRLVTWNPMTASSQVVTSRVPRPLVALQVSDDGAALVMLAGMHNQLLLIARYQDGCWNLRESPHDETRIIGVALDGDATLLLTVLHDRRLQLCHTSGQFISEIAIERLPDVDIHGMPLAWVLGRGTSRDKVFFVTAHGQLAAWNWRTGHVCKVCNYPIRDTLEIPVRLEMTSAGDTLRIRFANHFRLVNVERNDVSEQEMHHSGAVTACSFGAPGEIVSASADDGSLRWSSRVGLSLLKRRQVDFGQPTCIVSSAALNQVMVGTTAGLVCRYALRSDTESEYNPLGGFHGPVVAVWCTSNGAVIAANGLGEVKRIHVDRDWVSILFGDRSGQRKQIALLPPPGNAGVCLSVFETVNEAGITIAALNRNGGERIIRNCAAGSRHADVSEDARRLVVGGQHVDVLERRVPFFGLGGSFERWITLGRREVRVSHARFMHGGRYLAVVIADSEFLEIWEVSQYLPTVAAISLPATATCLATESEWLAVGLNSGSMLIYRLCVSHA